MEVYFTGTIERIIFENVSNFYRILLLDIEVHSWMISVNG